MLEIENLKVIFKEKKHQVTAVDTISFHIPENTIVGLVGESGSGKSVTALSLLRILPQNADITATKMIWKGQDLLTLTPEEMRKKRGKEIGLIFQNPLAALNPVYTIGNQLIETLQLHHQISKKEAKDRAISLLKGVSIPDPEQRLNEYPHQFSLGMCQRIMIALTAGMKPHLMIADEPTASLDVTIQAQVLSLLRSLKEETKMSMLFISHDLGIIAQHCDYILVMYLGRIVEKGTAEDIFLRPQHPYTQALISSIPIPDPTRKQTPQLIHGDIPSPIHIPSGCRFHTRCPKVMDICKTQNPDFYVKNTHETACLLYSNSK